MSYFEDYFNALGRKTLRGYTRLLDLTHYDAIDWETNDVAPATASRSASRACATSTS